MKTNHLVAASIAFICLGLIAMFKPNTVTQEPVRVLEIRGFDSDSLPYKIHVSAIALASMTDDEYGLYDYYIVTTDHNPRYTKGSIHRTLSLSSAIHPSCYRKATAEELIEHFKEE